ncbi:MAG TPA: radical SAM protein [Anaeromyxobacteraceae bacterium]|nr:radical SAM protein [Anaeromyxobacteraceae bacterium]
MSQWIAFHVTERCGLTCLHCLRDPGKKPAELSLELVDRLLGEARELHGIRHVGFTGGDPVLWPHLEGAVDAAAARGFTWHVVTSGKGFGRITDMLDAVPARRDALRILDFSVDGATEATHDAIRGEGSWRDVMAAIAACSARGIPFSMQMTLNARNEGELEAMGLLAGELGAKVASFAMMNATGRPEDAGLRLPPAAWDRVRDRAERLSTLVKVEVSIAEGFRRGDRFHLCEPFRSEVLHVTPWGELNLCCNLSGVPGPREDVVADLHHTSLADAHRRLLDLIHRLERERLDRIAAGPIAPGWDDFPCNRCLARFGKPHWAG